MKKYFILAVAFILVLTPAAYSFDFSEENESITMVVDEVRVINVDSPTRVLVSNPAIVDINIVNEKEIFLKAKKAGTTDILIWKGNVYDTLTVMVSAEDIYALADNLRILLDKAGLRKVSISPMSGQVILSGQLTRQEDLDRLKEITAGSKSVINLVTLKEDRPLVQVDMQVLEVTETVYQQLGVKWPSNYTVSGMGVATGETSLRAADSIRSAFSGPETYTATSSDFKLTFNALAQEGKARTLSRPNIVTLSGKEANILVGGQIPVVTTTSTSTATSESVEYKDYGIGLTILPTVSDKDRVNLKVLAEVSDIDDSRGTTDKPAFTTRSTETELYLEDSQTVIIAGLIKQKDQETLRRVPFLSKVPILGEFFKHRQTASSSSNPDEATELIITITPKVIRIDEDQEMMEVDILDKWDEKRAEDELPRSLASARPEVFNYTASVQRKIYDGLYYPYGARNAKIEGMVKLSLHVLANGDLLDVVVRESSGYHVLDRAAVDVAKTQAPYPRFPTGLQLKEIWVDIPIVYRMGAKGDIRK